jgi:iron complex transport system substrate-binding protein
VSLADNVQEQTKAPYLLFDGALDKMPEIYRKLGKVFGVEERAEALARYAEETLNSVKPVIDAAPESERPRVYYARGANGLETGASGSVHLEVPERVGAINVAASAGTGRLAVVSIQQVLSWNPDVILARSAILPLSLGRPTLEHSEGCARQARPSRTEPAVRMA